MYLRLVAAAAAAAMTAVLFVAQTSARKQDEKATRSTVAYMTGDMNLFCCKDCTQLHPTQQSLFKVLTAHNTSPVQHAVGIK
jgi:hypothetical protein